MHHPPSRRAAWPGLASMALLVGACSAQPPAAAPAPATPATPAPTASAASLRLIVFLQRDWPDTDPAGLAAQLSRLAGQPVTVLRPMAPRQWVVSLACASDAACAAARQRLQTDNPLVQQLEDDQRMRIPPQPNGAVLR